MNKAGAENLEQYLHFILADFYNIFTTVSLLEMFYEKIISINNFSKLKLYNKLLNFAVKKL
jgi:hypothetical protein